MLQVIKTSKIDSLYHIKRCIAKPGFKSLAELDEEFPINIVLKPKTPRVEPQREDSVTPRVSFSITLAGAAGSLGFNKTNGDCHIGIYKPTQAIHVYFPVSLPTKDKRFYVHDADVWGEVWSLRPVPAELQKIIGPGELIIL